MGVKNSYFSLVLGVFKWLNGVEPFKRAMWGGFGRAIFGF